MKRLSFLCLILLSFPSFSQDFPHEIYGNWKGNGRIVVNWTEARYLNYDININEDNSVTGNVGDAEIINGIMEPRSTIMKWLGNGDYIISGKLKSDILRSEKVVRQSFNFMFILQNNKLLGGMHTSGSMFGGKEKMVLTIFEIILNKSE